MPHDFFAVGVLPLFWSNFPPRFLPILGEPQGQKKICCRWGSPSSYRIVYKMGEPQQQIHYLPLGFDWLPEHEEIATG